MKRNHQLTLLAALFVLASSVTAQEPAAELRKAFIDGTGEGWRALGAD